MTKPRCAHTLSVLTAVFWTTLAGGAAWAIGSDSSLGWRGWIPLTLVAALPMGAFHLHLQGRDEASWRSLSAGSLTVLILLTFVVNCAGHEGDRYLRLSVYAIVGIACIAAMSGAVQGQKQRFNGGIWTAIGLLLILCLFPQWG